MGLAQFDPSFYQDLSRVYAKKRDQICNVLEQAGLRPFIPQGAYYILADASSLPGRNSKDKAMFLLEQTGVASVPGEAFFHDGSGKNLLRFCFATTEEKLDEACSRLQKLASAERSSAAQLAL